MATRLKTIQYTFAQLASVTDATDTNFTQITGSIAEGPSGVTFRSVVLEVQWQDASTSGGNYSRRQLSMSVGGSAYTVVNNTNTVTGSGEATNHQMSADFTSLFTAQWGTNATRTIDARIYVDASAATPINRGATAVLTITYEYDDTSATHTKTVWVPLDAPRTNLATSKPGTANAVIPALDTWLPENGKTIRQVSIVIQGNDNAVAVTDITINVEIDAAGSTAMPILEKALNSANWFRFLYSPSFDTSTTHNFFIWASLASSPTLQVWMVVTYDFTISGTTTAMQSLWVPMEWDSPLGNSAAEFQRATRDLWIQEPGTITIEESALFLFWEQAAAIASLNARVGTGSFLALTNAAAINCGGLGAMLRAESILTLARGRNALQADAYRIDTADVGTNVSSVWLINYTSGVHADGVGAHNRTVFRNLTTHGTAASNIENVTGTLSLTIPEADYFLNAIGLQYQYISNTTGTPAGVCIQTQRLSGEGGQAWDSIYVDFAHTDAEQGVHTAYATARAVFKRWPGDDFSNRLDIETARKYKSVLGNGCASWDQLDLVVTYHTITFDVADDVSGSDGTTVTLDLHRAASGEKVKSTTRSGDGAYSFTWYDDTEEMFVVATDTTKSGRSADALAV